MSRKNPTCDPSSTGCAPAPELRLPLRPHPLLPLLCATGLALLLTLILVMFWQGRFVAVSAGAVTAATLAAALWREWEGGGAAPTALLLGADGRLALQLPDGSRDPVQLDAGSFFIGAGVLLVLRGQRRHRLWLAPANLAPAQLAALRRWLSHAAVRSGGPGRNFLY
ncbi:MAG: hypothetical protein QM696_01940 [Steroidobacteraceae bacterium]